MDSQQSVAAAAFLISDPARTASSHLGKLLAGGLMPPHQVARPRLRGSPSHDKRWGSSRNGIASAPASPAVARRSGLNDGSGG
ncbi:hypothetical protein, partial [Klebsiella variicola]|uniref:hypothetical protein n=1 Tax=Klebsiella variicola TaxID=244366 RepID=UPI0019548BFA